MRTLGRGSGGRGEYSVHAPLLFTALLGPRVGGIPTRCCPAALSPPPSPSRGLVRKSRQSSRETGRTAGPFFFPLGRRAGGEFARFPWEFGRKEEPHVPCVGARPIRRWRSPRPRSAPWKEFVPLVEGEPRTRSPDLYARAQEGPESRGGPIPG